MYWYIKVLKNYFVFTGRARRSEYWNFVLINFMNSFLLSLIDMTFGLVDAETGYGTFSTTYGLAVLIPGVAVGIRRMHDVGKSGWYILIPFYNLVLAATPGVFGANKYGSDPKPEDQHTSNNFMG
ncbi:MAG: DUF805 domain-containing protein [Flavobacteriaceae bacterium]|nr:DUF805 domain-containing protein [Flavobacteriaceae bacterium]